MSAAAAKPAAKAAPRRARSRAVPAAKVPPTGRAGAVAATLAVLDRLLGMAVDKTARLLGPATLLDPWRGMHLDADDVRRALNPDGRPSLGDADAVAALSAPFLADARLAAVAGVAELDALDVAIVAVVMAPDIDLRYERICAYLQDDIARKRPSPDLVANLLSTTVADRLCVLRRFGADAPLQQRQVLLGCSPPDVPLLAGGLRLARPWLDAICHDLPDAEAAISETDAADANADTDTDTDADADATDDIAAALQASPAVATILRAARPGGPPVRLVVQGRHGAGKHDLAGALARAAGLRLRRLDLRDLATAADVQAALRRETTAAALGRALLYIHGAGQFGGPDLQRLRALHDALADPATAFVLSLTAPLPFAGSAALSADRLELALPAAPARERYWQAALARHGVAAAPDVLRATAQRFVLSRAQIAQAAADVQRQRPPGARAPTRARAAAKASRAELAAAARALCGEELARLAQRVRPAATFAELVATPQIVTQLQELCSRVALRDPLRSRLGGAVHQRGFGVNALFAGGSGTGKTLAAEIVAGSLDLDLFRIDLSAVVSKYIGETEKNLDRVFTAAASANAVLFFDEADALFGKRSEVKDAHDRYANIEISYLLQKIEQFEGVAILASNLRQNLDEAFTRRLTFCINFPFPEEAERARLWQTLWPAAAPPAADVDFAELARTYRVSGGSIRNIVTAALYLAAAQGGSAGRDHIAQAAAREFQKLGKTLAAVPAPAVAGRAA